MRFHILLSILGAACAAAQPLAFTRLPADGAAPTPRVDGTIAYDGASRRIYMFGGLDSSPRNDLWFYSLAQRRWEEVQVTGSRPAARFGHTLLHDAARRRLIVFGGQAAGFFSDVWAFQIDSGAWQQLAANEAGPSDRYGHSAILDEARGRMVISHGFTDAGRFDDTWAFDLASHRWTNITPSGTRPLKRCLHHAVYDPANSQMLLYGGCASGFGPCPLGDLWSFDLSANRWTERTSATRPVPRQHFGIAFDRVRARLLLYGGSGAGTLNDTWTWDVASNTWQQPVVVGAPPVGRSRHESAYAADRGTTFFFGGSTSDGSSNELWMLGPGFLPVQQAVAPGDLLELYGSNLGPIDGVSFAFDPLTGRLPTSGPGVDVTVNGVPAPLYYAQADQINLQVPYEIAGATEAVVQVTVNGRAHEPRRFPVVAANPRLYPVVLNQDGTPNSAGNPAAAGSVIVLFATGQGVTQPPSLSGAKPVDGIYPEPAADTSLTIGGQPAQVLFRGQAPGTAGVMQINAVVPSGVPSSAPVVLKVGLAESGPEVAVFVR
ncbi:MAG: hypothetical protein JNN08_14355 [Bryobacterales bacterium]|nr:hypothetical protein [Bryobacterales bacterium]